ncbi:MAG: Lin0512 family protein [Shimia sp.]
MTEHRLIIEMGMGNDLFGQDQTKAARRAIEDALRHSSLPLFEVTGLPHDEMRVIVTIGVPDPAEIDTEALHDALPHGQTEIAAVKGGLHVPTPADPGGIVVATAAVEVYLPSQAK